MTKAELQEIKDAMVQAQLELSRQNDEVWLRSEDFLKQFGMFNKDWLEHNGWRLPRERAEFVGDDGKTRVTRWAYPRNEIQRMIRDRELVKL